ncbi:Fc.00g078180.m01.CDS01 [Cosmosporella sp. VM-42]
MTASVPSWKQQPGLYRENEISNVPPYKAYVSRSVPAPYPISILPTFNHQTQTYDSFTAVEPIIVGVDFEDLCMAKVGETDSGRQYRYKPITEAGWSFLDVRALRQKGKAPGDRGNELFRQIKTRHFLVDEYRGHWGHHCTAHWHKTSPYLFGFGSSQIIKTDALPHNLNQAFLQLCKQNRTKEEIVNKKLRQIIFLTWDSQLEENTVARLGLRWFEEENVRLWDLQGITPFRMRFNRPKSKAESVMETMGLRFLDQRHGNLSHCAANDATFQLQLLLALFYMTPKQLDDFLDWKELPWLRYTWSGFTMDQVNAPPGQTPQPRPDSQRNDSNVPQVRNVCVQFYR